jgi:APA family basic amino acid/polyamine antiporter
MIGAGVFTTTGFLLADLHSRWLVLAAWTVGGFVALLGALCYGALASRIPESGGEYVFLARTIHPAAGYLAGWASLLVGFSAPLAAAAAGFGEYLRPIAGGVDPRWPGTILLLVFTVAHALHVRLGTLVQNASVLLKLAFLSSFSQWEHGQCRYLGNPLRRRQIRVPLQSHSCGFRSVIPDGMRPFT